MNDKNSSAKIYISRKYLISQKLNTKKTNLLPFKFLLINYVPYYGIMQTQEKKLHVLFLISHYNKYTYYIAVLHIY